MLEPHIHIYKPFLFCLIINAS